jgi:hypothetical protein
MLGPVRRARDCSASGIGPLGGKPRRPVRTPARLWHNLRTGSVLASGPGRTINQVLPHGYVAHVLRTGMGAIGFARAAKTLGKG